MSTDNYIIRNAAEKDLDFMIELARIEGWNPGLHDKNPFFNADKSGFFMGELNGVPVSCISTVTYEKKFGFLGFYIVKKEFRGKGYGMQIWNHGMDYLGSVSSGLDGVVEQQKNYEKSDYKFAHKQIRFEGTGLKGKLQTECISIKNISFVDLIKYDSSVFTCNRDEFLMRWISTPDSYSLAIADNSKVAGYGLIRKCFKGYKIGPIFADSKGIAEKLFLSLVEFAEGKEVYLDVPEINKEGMELKEKYNMKYVFETARMYKNGKPDIPVSKVFGVTTFELG